MDAEEQELERLNQEIGGLIQEALMPGVGFALMVFSFGPDGWMTFCSNAERLALAKALRQLLRRIESGVS